MRAALAALAAFTAFALLPAPARAQDAPVRMDAGRFTVVCYPGDTVLARRLLRDATRTDTFPGLPRPAERVLIAIAPDRDRFREWAGPGAPEWGAALAFPESRRIVMQGHDAGTDAGDPREVLRHELAHLALHEFLGDLPMRWFDEGYASYAAHEWRRDDVLATNVALALRGMPTFDELEARFTGTATGVDAAYALAFRAVSDLAALDPERGLAPLLASWKETGSLDRAVRATYGITLQDFEARWRTRTRRRYGALALFSDLAILGVFVLGMAGPIWFVRRRRNLQRMAALTLADEADAERERAERDRVLEELLGGIAPVPDPPRDEAGGGGGGARG